MEGSSSSSATTKEEITQKTAIFYMRRPCHFLEEAFRALFRCLGLGFGANREENNSVMKPPSDAEEEDPVTRENSEEHDADPPVTTAAQTSELNATLRRGRRSSLTQGSGPQIN